jgi:hypothetical protein
MTAAITTRAPLTQAGQALESSRDSGFDLSAAIGEAVDNSWESGASLIRIHTVEDDDQTSVQEIGIADNGAGIAPEILANVLSLGYSSRYGSRQGLGRFGVGLKLASLSQARRVEVYSKVRGGDQIYRTVLDLDDVRDGKQKDLSAEPVKTWPAEFAGIVADVKEDYLLPFEHGTLVVWRKIDRLQRGGRYGSSVDERMQDLTKFLARAYRRFIDKGLLVELDGRKVTLHDPLFLLENPRVTKKFSKDLRSEILDQGTFDIDGHPVEWIVSLLPEELRKNRGAGGRAGKGREEFADLYIPENEGKISILRNGREIYYDLVPKLFPGGKDRIDRYFGVEVSFPAVLDEYFQVRNVKRGAEPVSKLREDLRKALKKPIEAARKEIRRYWNEVEQAEINATGDNHIQAHSAVDGFGQTAPAGQAGAGASSNEIDAALKQLMEDLGLDSTKPEDQAKAKWIRDSFDQRALTVVDAQWPGKELLDIVHLNGKAIVKVNNRHPFFADFVIPLKAMAAMEADDLDKNEASRLLKKLPAAIDLLLLAYAKAENMHEDAEEVYSELRSHWGLFANGLLREYLRNQ